MGSTPSSLTSMVRRWPAVLLALLIVALPVGAAFAQSNAAQSDAAQSVQGKVLNRTDQNGKKVTSPVPGVRVSVELAGKTVGEATTDADGGYKIGLDSPGSYTVVLDVSTLPKGLTAENGKDQQVADVTANQNVTRVFFLGVSSRDTQSKWSLLPQTIANGVKLSMIIAITSIGLSLIFGTTGLSNFAHGEMVTLGAFVALMANRHLGLNVIPATGLAMIVVAAFGAGFDSAVWRPLRRRKTSLTSMMIVSIGLALAFRYMFLYFYGGTLKSYSNYTLQVDPVSIGPVDLPPRTLVAMGVALAVIVAVALFLLKARFGKAIRAVSDNPDLASSSGIDTNRVILVVWIIGGALAGLGGVLYGLEFGVKWDMGFTLLLLMFAAITLGGLGNPFGALVGSFVIGLFVELWTWIVPNANDLKTVGALVALILVLLIRPQGLLGNKERIG